MQRDPSPYYQVFESLSSMVPVTSTTGVKRLGANSHFDSKDDIYSWFESAQQILASTAH